jgi:hypothetical protein
MSGGKVGWWQNCAAAIDDGNVHCTIWNGAGLVLVDEEFLPYDGGRTPIASELKITADPTFAGPDRVILVNNRVLLPSGFAELKRFVDSLQGKRKGP